MGRPLIIVTLGQRGGGGHSLPCVADMQEMLHNGDRRRRPKLTAGDGFADKLPNFWCRQLNRFKCLFIIAFS